jgi:DNA-binding NarL/FixJ family response regulator
MVSGQGLGWQVIIHTRLRETMQTIRIFLIDDSIGFILSAEKFLKTFPHVEVVGHEMSARKALVLLPSLHVDVVLLDLVMPEMDGLEFLRCAKGQPDAPLMVILTLFDDPIYRKAAESALADGFVPKTEFGTQLMPLIYKLLGAKEEPG